MAYRDRGLIIDSLGHNWNSQASPAAAATCTASASPSSSATKMCLTQLGWSIRNAGAAAYTATLNVRDASISGTVLASWDVVVGAGVSAQDNFITFLKSTKGNPINVDFGTPASSVTQKISIAGWEEKNTQA